MLHVRSRRDRRELHARSQARGNLVSALSDDDAGAQRAGAAEDRRHAADFP
jgi:hypothetical protein